MEERNTEKVTKIIKGERKGSLAGVAQWIERNNGEIKDKSKIEDIKQKVEHQK